MDTTTGHWEMMGIVTERPFPTYPDGFPAEIIDEFARAHGRGVIGNVAARAPRSSSASATSTSAPAAGSSTRRPTACSRSPRTRRSFRSRSCTRPAARRAGSCGRARGRPGDRAAVRGRRRAPTRARRGGTTSRSSRRARTTSSASRRRGRRCTAWARSATSSRARTSTQPPDDLERAGDRDHRGADATLADGSLVFTNLVETDMLWGHRNDPRGFADALEEFDGGLPGILAALRHGDLLVLTSDHGCDPTTPSTDHSREHGLLIAHVPGRRSSATATTATRSQTSARPSSGCSPARAPTASRARPWSEPRVARIRDNTRMRSAADA